MRLFASVSDFRDGEDSTVMAERLMNSIAKLRAIDSLSGKINEELSPKRNNAVPPLKQSKTPTKHSLLEGSVDSRLSNKKQFPSLLSSNLQYSQASLTSSPDYVPQHHSSLPALSGVNRNQQKDQDNRLPFESLDKSMAQRQPRAPLSTMITSSSKASVATSRAARVSGGSVSAIGQYSSEQSPRSPTATKKSFDPNRIYEAAGLSNSTTSVQYRVRGSSEQSNWIAAVDVDEEEMLRKELIKAQKKLKKQQQLQEWLKEKEDRASNAQHLEEEERKAMQQAEVEKEKKRLARVKQIKKKLNGYHDQIKSDAEKIQELLDIGIDPSSLI